MLRAAAVVAALALGGAVGVSGAPPLAASTRAQEAPDRCADEPGAQRRPCVGPVTDESGGGGDVWTIALSVAIGIGVAGVAFVLVRRQLAAGGPSRTRTRAPRDEA